MSLAVAREILIIHYFYFGPREDRQISEADFGGSVGGGLRVCNFEVSLSLSNLFSLRVTKTAGARISLAAAREILTIHVFTSGEKRPHSQNKTTINRVVSAFPGGVAYDIRTLLALHTVPPK